MAYSRFEPFSSVDIPDDEWASNVDLWRQARDAYDPVAPSRPQMDPGFSRVAADPTDALGAARMPHADWQMARAQQVAMRDGGLAPLAAKSAPAALKPASPIDPNRTPVFQPGPDGKLHPIPGWRTTGPFDVGTWAKNIDWRGVRSNALDIGLGIPGWLLPPYLGAAETAALMANIGKAGKDTEDELEKVDRRKR